MRQTRKLVYAAGWINRLPSTLRNSLQFMTCDIIKTALLGKWPILGHL